MKCCECGAEIDHVLVNEFQRDGTDRYALRPLEDLGDDCYSVITDTSWTGYGLETEDCLADVYCPKCKKFPFKTKDMEQYELVQLVFLELREARGDMNNLIEFAKEQCTIFPEDSEMGKYLRETMKMLQAESCEDAISREDAIKAVDRHTFNTDDGLCLDEDISIILEELPPVKPARKKGKWIIDDKEYNRIWDCHCSECKKDPQGFIGGSEDWWVVRLPKYCPYCGSLMEVEE